MHLTPPSEEHKESYIDFVKEWADTGEDIVPYFVRQQELPYEEWLKYSKDLASWETCPKNFVPSSNYFLFDEDRLVGALNLRHTLNDNLLFRGGHIGYGVRPSERGKGYASEMLRLGLEEARKYGIKRVLVTCAKDNISSAKVIQKNGGVLENEVDDEGEITQRYWITLS